MANQKNQKSRNQKNENLNKLQSIVVANAEVLSNLKTTLLEMAQGTHETKHTKAVVNLATGEVFKSILDAYEIGGYNRARVSEASREEIEFYRGERWACLEDIERCARYLLHRFPEAKAPKKAKKPTAKASKSPKAKSPKVEVKTPKKVIIRKVVRR